MDSLVGRKVMATRLVSADLGVLPREIGVVLHDRVPFVVRFDGGREVLMWPEEYTPIEEERHE